MEGSMTLDPKIYRRAAEIVFNRQDYYACYAITSVTKIPRYSFDKHLSKFEITFDPYMETSIWFGHWNDPENRLARQLALLFMEQIAKDLMKEKR